MILLYIGRKKATLKTVVILNEFLSELFSNFFYFLHICSPFFSKFLITSQSEEFQCYFKVLIRPVQKSTLKGVFAKYERGYRLTAKSKCFWSLLLSVASLRRKLLKITNAEERSVHTNSESCNIQLGL